MERCTRSAWAHWELLRREEFRMTFKRPAGGSAGRTHLLPYEFSSWDPCSSRREETLANSALTFICSLWYLHADRQTQAGRQAGRQFDTLMHIQCTYSLSLSLSPLPSLSLCISVSLRHIPSHPLAPPHKITIVKFIRKDKEQSLLACSFPWGVKR